MEKLELLKENFQQRLDSSSDKDTLLDMETEGHTKLFDNKLLPLNTKVFDNDRPLLEYGLRYNTGDIVRIREAYIRYIVNGCNIDEDGEICSDRGRLYRLPPSDFQVHYFNEAQARYSYLLWLNTFNAPEPEQLVYVLDESFVIKLYELYGDLFPGETKELWKKRWIDAGEELTPITLDKFKSGNNKHLLLTILHEAHPSMKVDKMQVYARQRWGLKSYPSDISKHINSLDEKAHPELSNIRELLKTA